ncbi:MULTISPECIES: sigma 54-interacting transcriptional regulator [Geomonas]|uniref:sigma 54-interacting transcriptional regulator n=1 Tax=Geomonas TaxID=2651583 RepID=UPI0010A85BD9|nr:MULTISPECIES: sigma 54-interacting transcriptional regulator [Geomonas]
MAVNKDEFFREVTLKICSSLDIRVAVKRAFDYLREHFPLDEIYLDIMDSQLGAIRRIAHFANSDGEAAKEIVPLPELVWGWGQKLSGPLIMDARALSGPAKMISELVELAGNSDLVLPLRVENELIGVLALRAYGEGRYNQGDAELLSTVADPFALALANALSYGEVLRYRDTLLDDNRFLRSELVPRLGDEIIGGNSGLRNVMEMAQQIAPLSNTVLLMGETGTGKDVIANAIHFASSRKDGPFIKVNCGAISESLIDSELFGHEKGAFTGAITEKRGRFERADGGTIFLDEIGELPPQAQVRLLRVLQHKEIERVGGDRAIPVDIRVIAATHRNLEGMVAENQFREDLWFRLNVFPIIVPPLRQRREDVPALARHFVEVKCREFGISSPPAIAPGVLERMMNYWWPGNVRELENLVERELIRYRGGQLKFDSLLLDEKSAKTPSISEELTGGAINLDEAMAAHISKVLKMAKGKVHGPGGAAELLGINPNTLRGRMSKLGLKYGKRT